MWCFNNTRGSNGTSINGRRQLPFHSPVVVFHFYPSMSYEQALELGDKRRHISYPKTQHDDQYEKWCKNRTFCTHFMMKKRIDQ